MNKQRENKIGNTQHALYTYMYLYLLNRDYLNFDFKNQLWNVVRNTHMSFVWSWCCTESCETHWKKALWDDCHTRITTAALSCSTWEKCEGFKLQLLLVTRNEIHSDRSQDKLYNSYLKVLSMSCGVKWFDNINDWVS